MIRNLTASLRTESELRDACAKMKRKEALAWLEEIQLEAAAKAQYEVARAALVVREELEAKG